MSDGKLFTDEELIPWLAEWKNMPEYVIEDLAPKHQIILNFASSADVEEFGKLIGQNIRANKNTDKRLEFAQELQKAHPDIVTVTEKWGRWHHQVDYSGFRHPLRRREGIEIPDAVNNFGMVLQEKIDGKWVMQ